MARSVGLGDPVRIAVSWSATELAAFRAVLRGRGIDNYELIPLGDDIDAALGARTSGRPDVVALPRPGHVRDNLARLQPGLVDERHPALTPIWRASLPPGGYALPFKITHKSVVWYRGALFAEHGLAPPRTWAEWIDLNERILARPGLGAPLALGGADGWMLNGLFENVLLRNFGDTYDALTRMPREPRLWDSGDVRAAFDMLGELCAPGVFAGGLEGALVQQFPDAVLEVFRYRRAAMVVAPDFAESVIRHFGVPEDEVGTFTFPSRSGPGGPLVLGGDLLVASGRAGEGVRDLIRALGQPDAPVPWIRDTGGFLAAHPGTGQYSAQLGPLSAELRARDVRFDLSDELGATGGRDGLERVLQDFLRGLAAGAPRADAVRAACAAMVAVARERS